MSTREALVDAIRAAPGDPVPRLVLADWLDEHGEPERAAFVRLHCERDNADARDRAFDLFAANRRRWFDPLLAAAGCDPAWYAAERTDRGMPVLMAPLRPPRFVRAVGVEYGFAWQVLADLCARRGGSLGPLLDAEPIHRLVASVGRPGDWAAATVPALGRVRTLVLDTFAPITNDARYDLDDAVGLDLADAAFGDPHLSGVRSIGLVGVWPGAEVTARFAASPLAARTTDVSLSGGADAVGRLAVAPAGLPWERFSIHNLRDDSPPAAADALAVLPFRGNVRELTLAGAGDAILAAVATASGWDRLERLDTYCGTVGGDGLRAVAASSLAARLRSVRLYENPRLGDDPAAVLRLADALDPERLEELDVRNCRLPPAVAAALRERFGDRARVGDDV